MDELVIIFLCGFFAYILSSISGGGAGFMLMPVLESFLPIVQVPPVLSIGTFSSTVSKIILFRKNICWKIVKYFVPTAVLSVILGSFLLKYINPIYLKFFMGLFLISNISFLFKNNKSLTEVQKSSNYILLIIGFFAGFLSGLTGAIGVLFNRFYLGYGLTKESIIATRSANEVILHIIKIVLYSLFGLMTTKVILFGVVISISAILSSISMKWIFSFMSEILFKKIGYFAMVFSGIYIMYQSGKDIIIINNVDIFKESKDNGLELKLLWSKKLYSLEYSYKDGFEFEQIIPIEQLTKKHRDIVLKNKKDADTILIEIVYTINKISYEAYYYKENTLVNKIHFD